MMLCRDIELACDEKVIKDMSFEDKKEYSRVLLSCASQKRLVFALGDKEAYAFLDMNYKYMVLLTSDLIYDEGSENQASVCCDIYYPVAGEAKKLGTMISDGTAYPIAFTKDAIFVASGHKTEKFAISEAGDLYLEKGVYEQFDEAGNARYTAVIRGEESELTEQEYQTENEYGRSQIVHFSYGADGSINEYFEAEAVLAVNDSAMDIEDLHREMERVVSSIGLENAYP